MKGSMKIRRSCARLMLLAAAPALLFLLACPFSSSKPLSDPAQAVLDGALVGDWTAVDPESKESVTVTFLPFNGQELVAFSRSTEDAHGKVDLYRVFVTVIDGERFLNVRELGARGDEEWSFANYRVVGASLSLRFIDDGLFGSQTFDTSDALREFVRGHLSAPGLYASDGASQTVMSFTRAGKP